jgi:hypothetical protein
MLKIYHVSFNDGGWHQTRPSATVVASSIEEAIEKAKIEKPTYRDWDCSAYEFTIDGYVIEVYDEKTYKRDKNISELI